MMSSPPGSRGTTAAPTCGSRVPRRHQRLQLLRQFQPLLERQPGERLADVELLAVAVVRAVVVRARTWSPACTSRRASPDASGSRTMTATPFAWHSSNSAVAGVWRKMLKMICSDAQPRLASRHAFASAIDSTLAPNRRILPFLLEAAAACRTPRRASSSSSGTQCSCVRSSASMPSRFSEFSVCSRMVGRGEVVRPAGRREPAELGGDEEAGRAAPAGTGR